MTALQKAHGGVRGIVAGEIVRRPVARTMSKQLMESVQAATAPVQHAMSTKSGCECWEGGGRLVGQFLHHTSLHTHMPHTGSRDTSTFSFSLLFCICVMFSRVSVPFPLSGRSGCAALHVVRTFGSPCLQQFVRRPSPRTRTCWCQRQGAVRLSSKAV